MPNYKNYNFLLYQHLSKAETVDTSLLNDEVYQKLMKDFEKYSKKK